MRGLAGGGCVYARGAVVIMTGTACRPLPILRVTDFVGALGKRDGVLDTERIDRALGALLQVGWVLMMGTACGLCPCYGLTMV